MPTFILVRIKYVGKVDGRTTLPVKVTSSALIVLSEGQHVFPGRQYSASTSTPHSRAANTYSSLFII